MRKLSLTVFVTLLLALPICNSSAATIHYNIDGKLPGSYPGYFEFDINKSRSFIQETLPSGVKHNRYEFDLYESGLPPKTKYDYRIFNEANGGIFLSPQGVTQEFSIDQYLNLDGSSALSIVGKSRPDCHGGCSIEEEIFLNYMSNGSNLFGNLAHPLSFEGLSSATAKSINIFTGFISVPPSVDTTITQFDIGSTVAVVPEMSTWIFMLCGLGFTAYFLRRKKSLNFTPVIA